MALTIALVPVGTRARTRGWPDWLATLLALVTAYAILLALLDSGWQEMVLVIPVYSVLNVTIQTFIQPRYVGNTVGLSAEMTYLSRVVRAYLLGALLAVPTTLLLRAFFIDADPRAAWAAPLIDAQVDYPDADPHLIPARSRPVRATGPLSRNGDAAIRLGTWVGPGARRRKRGGGVGKA